MSSDKWMLSNLYLSLLTSDLFLFVILWPKMCFLVLLIFITMNELLNSWINLLVFVGHPAHDVWNVLQVGHQHVIVQILSILPEMTNELLQSKIQFEQKLVTLELEGLGYFQCFRSSWTYLEFASRTPAVESGAGRSSILKSLSSWLSLEAVPVADWAEVGLLDRDRRKIRMVSPEGHRKSGKCNYWTRDLKAL